jgi:hypothetical protein
MLTLSKRLYKGKSSADLRHQLGSAISITRSCVQLDG